MKKKIELIKDLGCVFTKDEMEDAYKKNNGGKSAPFPIGPELFENGNPSEDIDPDNQQLKDDDPPENCPSKNARENFTLG